MANQYCALIYSIYQTGAYTWIMENNKDNSSKKATEKKFYGSKCILPYMASKMLESLIAEKIAFMIPYNHFNGLRQKITFGSSRKTY